MTKKLMIALVALALSMFVFAACGDDDSGDSGSSDTTAEAPAEETPAEEEPAEEEPAEEAGSNGGGSTLQISADPGGGLSYETGDLTASAGSVEIDFENASSTPHDVLVEDSSGNSVGGTSVISESSETATVDLEPGTFTYYCSVGSHRSAGMEGTITVE